MTGREDDVPLPLSVSSWFGLSSPGGRARGRFFPVLPREANASSSSSDEELPSKPLRGRRFTIIYL